MSSCEEQHSGGHSAGNGDSGLQRRFDLLQATALNVTAILGAVAASLLTVWAATAAFLLWSRRIRQWPFSQTKA